VDGPADLHFDDWSFRRQPPELSRAGVRVRLQEQPLQVLDELLARPGEIVTREQLIARLWPKRIVEFEAGLNAAVRRLRAALGDEAEKPRYIETVPRKGYRFIGTLQLPPSVQELAGVSDSVLTALPTPPMTPLSMTAPPMTPPSMAPAPMMMMPPSTTPTPTTAAAELPGPPLPSVPLTKPSPLWGRVSGKYRSASVMAAATMVIALGVFSISQWRESDAADARPTAAIDESLKRAQFFTQRRAPGDLARAKRQYEWASSLDPSSARAWAGLASVHWLQIAEGEQPRETTLPKVGAAARKALDLDPRLAEAHLRMALYLKATGNVSAAREHCTRAAALAPNDPLVLALLAGGAADEGRWEEAIVLQRRATAADPLSPIAAANLAHFLFLAGRFEEAKQEFAKVIELDPTHPNEIVVLTQILEGHYDEALRIVETWADSATREQAFALIYHGLGRSAQSDERLGKLIATAGRSDPVLVAEVYAFRGETEAAFEWLRPSRSPLEIPGLVYASPFLKSLHADSRWAHVKQLKH
jgi:DNA-binding winged helix-turn-helix (wHTH) protein/tetratricopeptide (TPR) repeat protein